jgi:hypothetical protein
MMSIYSLMDIEEKCLTFLSGDAPLKDAQGATTVQLLVVD